MPRIHDYIQDCVIYLYPSEDHAVQGEKVGGSGFLVHVPISSNPNHAVIFAVTNKHVIRQGHSPVVRLNNKDGTLAIADFKKEQWIDHPGGDDLAVVPIGLNTARQRISSIPREMLISQKIIEEHDIGLGDDIFVVGRFINHEGKQKNTPSLRFGNISQMPGDKIKQDTGFLQESFLVEAKSIGGYSGSPVFVHMLPLSSRPKKDDPKMLLTVPLPGIGPWLLGVDWGHIQSWEWVIDDKTGKPTQQKYKVRSNTGMMAVVPAWKLEELLNTKRIQKLMRIADDTYRRNIADVAGVADSVLLDSDIVGDGILHSLPNTSPVPKTKVKAKFGQKKSGK